jgi:hypothetical protein
MLKTKDVAIQAHTEEHENEFGRAKEKYLFS